MKIGQNLNFIEEKTNIVRIDLYVNRAEVSSDKITKNQIAVVVDVLRATTSMVTAFAHGCAEIIPVAEVEQAERRAREFGGSDVLLCGERNEQPLPGFDLSNSPLEYMGRELNGKTIVLTTTNGSQLFGMTDASTDTVIASFLNVSAVANFLMKEAIDVAVLCAGKYGEFGMEDVVCGGMLIDKIVNQKAGNILLNDGGIAALRLYEYYSTDIQGMLTETNHGKRLIEIGREEDVSFAGQIDVYNIVPHREGGVIRVIDN